MPDQFYVPEVWRVQDQKNKQSSLIPEGEMNMWQGQTTEFLQSAYGTAYSYYQSLLARGVAKELARMVLPVGIYTEIYMNVDLHNLMHFFTLRTDHHAQKEIRDVAWAMVQITENLFPWSIDLWGRYECVYSLKGKGKGCLNEI
jgi:thymidylate synthase (FAD)